MGTMQSQGWFQDMKIPKFSWSFILKENNLNSKIKFEREPTEKKFQKIKHQGLKEKKKYPCRSKGSFFKWKVFLKKKNFKQPLLKNHKVFDKNQIKILECHNPTPLGKISSPRFQLILKQVWMLSPKKILAFPSCFTVGVIALLNSEEFDGLLSGPPFRLL